jgi:hypothetical protein
MKIKIAIIALFVSAMTYAQTIENTVVKEDCKGCELRLSQQKDEALSKRADEAVKAPKLQVEKQEGNSVTVLITDGTIQHKFQNREFRDQFTALFGIDAVNVSLSEPTVRIIGVQDEVKKYLVEQLGCTTEEIKELK